MTSEANVAQKRNGSTTQWLFGQMLDRIQQGVWPVGESIPAERELLAEFGVSRFPLREALSMLRGFGILDIGHGRKGIVRSVDSDLLGRLFPLMLSLKVPDVSAGVRCPLGHRISNRIPGGRATHGRGVEPIERVGPAFSRSGEDRPAEAIQTDLEFHQAIGHATGNLLFPALLTALSGFVLLPKARASNTISSGLDERRRFTK